MASNMIIGDGVSEAGIPLLDDDDDNDDVTSFVDFNGHRATRSKSGYWKSASFIIGVEVAARCAYAGISSNLISYLTGPLGQPTAAAAANVNAWNGTASLLPLLGGFIADSYLGRYRTILFAASLYIMGLGFLCISATFDAINSFGCKTEENIPQNCSPPPLQVIVATFFSLYLVAFAEGGIRPCLQAFGADQFDDEDKYESKAKSSFFNWWFFSMCGGSLLALLVLNYIQENLSWALGFGIPCIIMCFSLIIFLHGSLIYRFRIKSDEENSFARISRALVKVVKVRYISRFTSSTQTADQGTLIDTRDIDDAKAILGLFPIWCTCLGYAIILSQVSTLFTKQGSTMNRDVINGFQIPAASLQSLISFSVLVFIPIYDRILVPIAETLTKKPAGISVLQRIGTGLFLSFICMVIAALVERRRLAVVVEPMATVPMSVWWLAPQYVLFGICDVFVIVGLQEFFYDQAPSELKSIGVALYLSILGIGSFLSSLLIIFIEEVTCIEGNDGWFSNDMNRARVDYFYWLLAALDAVTMAAYFYFANAYVYKRKIYCDNMYSG